MKNKKRIILVTFVISGIMFARTADNNPKIEVGNKQSKSNHYWVEGISDNGDVKLDRKRSHKRRRKIRKPVKGLR